MVAEVGFDDGCIALASLCLTCEVYLPKPIADSGGVLVGLGIGVGLKGLLEAMSRQPEIAGKAFINFLVGAALAEACALYALVVSFKLLGMF